LRRVSEGVWERVGARQTLYRKDEIGGPKENEQETGGRGQCGGVKGKKIVCVGLLGHVGDRVCSMGGMASG